MFRDCWDYICYKIQDTILKNGQLGQLYFGKRLRTETKQEETRKYK